MDRQVTETPRVALPLAPPPRRKRVCFLYIAQAHQVLHSISAAVELARRAPDVDVEVAATSTAVLAYARQVVKALGGAPIRFRRLGPAPLRWIADRDGTPPKAPMLVANALRLSRYDALVTPERTTALLRKLGVRRPKLVYTQHGAGDRAGPFEPRLRKFDLVFAAGPKQRDRMVESGLVAPERCAVVGYPKFDVVERMAAPRPRAFAQARPIVLYNPHFHRTLGSWDRFGPAVLAAFAGQSKYNLIFAPHLRLFAGRKPADIPELRPYLDHPGIHIDLGDSQAAIDMTYARAADVYLGDVSSQVYEFAHAPRPCVFLNASDADWRGDESYAHWRFGPVLDDVSGLFPTIETARGSEYLAEQRAACRRTFGESTLSASVRAAEAIGRLVGCELPVNDAEPALAHVAPEAAGA